MQSYVLLSTVTARGDKTLHENPERIVGVDREVAAFGCKVVSQYAVLGEYDFVTIVEAPDNATIAHLSIDLASRGTVKIVTLPAIPISDLVEKLKSAGHVEQKA